MLIVYLITPIVVIILVITSAFITVVTIPMAVFLVLAVIFRSFTVRLIFTTTTIVIVVIWLTGIRREETEHRKSLDIVSIDNRGILKVAPIFYWSEDDVEAYMEQHQLPTCRHYFDPTKVHDGRECGLHTAA